MNVIESVTTSFLFLIQIGILIFFPFHLMRSFFFSHKREQKVFRTIHYVVEIILMILLALCFYNYEMSSFRGEKLFPLFSFVTLISVAFYWISKFEITSQKYMEYIAVTFLGTLFWISLFTTIKFTAYLPYCWFPLLGLYAITPLLFAILSLSEIRYFSYRNDSFNTIQILLLGLAPLALIQIIMNFYTTSSWELIKLFDPYSSLPII